MSRHHCIDSIAKENAYRAAYRLLTPIQRRGYHIVLVGYNEETGEVQCSEVPILLGMRISRRRIICCGDGPETKHGVSAREWACQKYGIIKSPYFDLQGTIDWVLKVKGSIGSINADFCGTVVQAKQLPPILERSHWLTLYVYSARRDTFHSDDDRAAELRRIVGYDPLWTERYRGANGTPMVMNAFGRTYNCSTCGKRTEHPLRHKRNCNAQHQ